MSYSTLYDSYYEDPFAPPSQKLEEIKPKLFTEEGEPDQGPSLDRPPRRRRPRGGIRYPRIDPGSAAVIRELSGNNPELSSFDLAGYEASSESESEEQEEEDSEMGESALDPAEPGIGDVPEPDENAATSIKSEQAEHSSSRTHHATAIANAALNHGTTAELEEGSADYPSVQRHDSGHAEALPQHAEKDERSGRTALKLDTQHSHDHSKPSDDTIAASPTLRKHMVESAAGTLPAIDGQAASPQLEKLPSVHQITMGGDTLNELAEAATQRDPRTQTYSHHHSQSLGSAGSPVLPYHPPSATQTSPSTQYAISARSPASAMSDPYYGSPPLHSSSSAYYLARRSSAVVNTPTFPSLPSAASSNESQGLATSSADGYTPSYTPSTSTTTTTPNEQGSVPEGTPGQTGTSAQTTQMSHGYRCDHPGCTASPFQTQYLLSSHRNVHSSTRNHFCPIAGCPRGENGVGFKRKNEMKRHALVHRSPGYTCPFCPDKEHKYPRPDNLQRHVRVHHVDKNRDDPQLREVLAARNDGIGKAARRRRNTAS